MTSYKINQNISGWNCDAGHDYENVYNDLNHWWPKLKNNGILILDDYDNILFPELVQAVDQFILDKVFK